jgi:sarcosine oxidase/L-pipecolate oxidase
VSKVLKAESCGKDKDRAWKWKSEGERNIEGGLEFGQIQKRNASGRRELIVGQQEEKARL